MANEEKLAKWRVRGFRHYTNGTFIESVGKIPEDREVG
jgi:hypothetical protein